MTGNVRESSCGRGIREDRITEIFGHVQVQTPAACVAGECYIHCAMPLELKVEIVYNLSIRLLSRSITTAQG